MSDLDCEIRFIYQSSAVSYQYRSKTDTYTHTTLTRRTLPTNRPHPTTTLQASSPLPDAPNEQRPALLYTLHAYVPRAHPSVSSLFRTGRCIISMSSSAGPPLFPSLALPRRPLPHTGLTQQLEHGASLHAARTPSVASTACSSILATYGTASATVTCHKGRAVP